MDTVKSYLHALGRWAWTFWLGAVSVVGASIQQAVDWGWLPAIAPGKSLTEVWWVVATVCLVGASFRAFYVVSEDLRECRKLDLPGSYELTKDFSEKHAAAREAIAKLTALVTKAFRAHTSRTGPASEDWKAALPDPPTNARSPVLESFGSCMAQGGCAGLLGGHMHENEPQDYASALRTTEQFFTHCEWLRVNAPGFYTTVLEPAVMEQQFDVLHLLTYLRPAQADVVYKGRRKPKSEQGWSQLWHHWCDQYDADDVTST